MNINRIGVNSAKFKASRPKNMTLNVKKISLALKYALPKAEDAIELMKCQYDKNNNLLK